MANTFAPVASETEQLSEPVQWSDLAAPALQLIFNTYLSATGWAMAPAVPWSRHRARVPTLCPYVLWFSVVAAATTVATLPRRAIPCAGADCMCSS